MRTVTASSELRPILPTWGLWGLLPLPAATFWNVSPSRDFACHFVIRK